MAGRPQEVRSARGSAVRPATEGEPVAEDRTPSVAYTEARRLLKRAEKAGLDAWLLMHGLPTKGETARLWRRWLRNGIRKANRVFGNPTTEEVAAFVAAEVKRDLRRPEVSYYSAAAREEWLNRG